MRKTMNTMRRRLMGDASAFLLWGVLYIFPAWLNPYSAVIDHTFFYQVYGLFGVCFWGFRVWAINKRFYWLVFPIMVYVVAFAFAMLLHPSPWHDGIAVWLMYASANYFLLGFWLFNLLLYLSCRLNKRLSPTQQ